MLSSMPSSKGIIIVKYRLFPSKKKKKFQKKIQKISKKKKKFQKKKKISKKKKIGWY